MKNVVILGSTGSIGKNALRVIRDFKKEFRVLGLVTNKNIKMLKSQVEEFKPEYVGIFDTKKGKEFFYKKGKVLLGQEGVIKISTLKEADIILFAIPGFSQYKIFFEILKKGKKIALANKEILVSFREIVKKEMRFKDQIIPVDSEHSAIFRCIHDKNKKKIKKIYLTCSGGPFLNWSKRRLRKVSVKEVLKHPKWKMGPKISVDSATLMNKGLEVIEAQVLFDLDLNKIEILIHPEAVIHGMVEFIDSSILALLSQPDMRLPILYALSFPEEQKFNLNLDFLKLKNLSFSKPDLKRFKCLELALRAAKLGKSFPCVLNASNEICVEYFLKRKIGFLDIPKIIEKTIKAHKPVKNPTLDDIVRVDRWAREFTLKEIEKLC